MTRINARTAFSVDFTPLDTDGEPLGFSPYTAGQDVDGSQGDLTSFFHILKNEDIVKILTSSGATFTTSVAHGRAANDWIVIRDHAGRAINNTAYQIATVPTSKTFTISGLAAGSGTGGRIYPVMVTDDDIVMKSVILRVSADTDTVSYTVEKGLAQVTEETKCLVEFWREVEDGLQVNDVKEFTLAPSFGASPY